MLINGLATWRSAGVTPKVSLRNPLYTGEKARKQGDQPWLWNPRQTVPDVQTGVSVAPQKRLMFSKKLKQKSAVIWWFSEKIQWIYHLGNLMKII